MRALLSDILSDKTKWDYILMRPNKFPESKVTENHMRQMCRFGIEQTGNEAWSKGGLRLSNVKEEGNKTTGEAVSSEDDIRHKGLIYGAVVFTFVLEDKGDFMQTIAWPNMMSWFKGRIKPRTLIAIPDPQTPPCVRPDFAP